MIFGVVFGGVVFEATFKIVFAVFFVASVISISNAVFGVISVFFGFLRLLDCLVDFWVLDDMSPSAGRAWIEMMSLKTLYLL